MIEPDAYLILILTNPNPKEIQVLILEKNF